MPGWGDGAWGGFPWGGLLDAPSILTQALPAGENGTAYSQQLAGTGGITPYTWDLSVGTLPTGLSLSSSGLISGTPTVNGTSNFTVRLTDALSQIATKALSIQIVAPPIPVTIETSSLPPGIQDQFYNTALVATGGTSPYSWSVSLGGLPEGLSLSSDGTISGTPTVAGLTAFTVKATDSVGGTDTQPFALVIGLPIAFLPFFLPPSVKAYPGPEDYTRAPNMMGRPKGLYRMAWYWKGVETKVGATTYQGGRWNGPLTDAQVSELQAAGYGARIVTVADQGQLPPGLD